MSIIIGGKSHKSVDKKKPSPSRRGSSTGDTAGSGSKNSTPAPSPQHTAPEQTSTPPAKGNIQNKVRNTIKVTRLFWPKPTIIKFRTHAVRGFVNKIEHRL